VWLHRAVASARVTFRRHQTQFTCERVTRSLRWQSLSLGARDQRALQACKWCQTLAVCFMFTNSMNCCAFGALELSASAANRQSTSLSSKPLPPCPRLATTVTVDHPPVRWSCALTSVAGHLLVARRRRGVLNLSLEGLILGSQEGNHRTCQLQATIQILGQAQPCHLCRRAAPPAEPLFSLTNGAPAIYKGAPGSPEPALRGGKGCPGSPGAPVSTRRGAPAGRDVGARRGGGPEPRTPRITE
jgi:hypothetical protein